MFYSFLILVSRLADVCCSVVVNGDVVAQGSEFSLNDVEVAVAQVDLDAIKYHVPEKEIAFGPACWLWDYLRTSGASGFLLPLSSEFENGDDQVKTDAIRIGQYTDRQFPTDSKEFAKRIFYTVYIGTKNSFEATRTRAKKLADEVDGGSNAENLGLQNIQAQIRIVLAFLFASLMPFARLHSTEEEMRSAREELEASRKQLDEQRIGIMELNARFDSFLALLGRPPRTDNSQASSWV